MLLVLRLAAEGRRRRDARAEEVEEGAAPSEREGGLGRETAPVRIAQLEMDKAEMKEQIQFLTTELKMLKEQRKAP